MKTFRAWFTPGSISLAMIVCLLWLHRLPMPLVGRQIAQVGLLALAFAGLWALAGEGSPGV